MRYGGNADVARVAALLSLCGLTPVDITGYRNNDITTGRYDETTGEAVYSLRDKGGRRYTVTPRELSQMAQKALLWFEYPYGDPGELEEKDENGKVIKEERKPVRGYVGPMHDAMSLPQDEIKIPSLHTISLYSQRFITIKGLRRRCFQLPQLACANLTWEQYRALQNVTPQLFAEDNSEEKTLDLQAQFLAHILTPRSFALFDSVGGNIKLRPHQVYQYNSERAERLVRWFRRQLSIINYQLSILFHICFQVYQTALAYYAAAFPLLFAGGGKQDPLRDALTGEVGTINTIMKYQGYSDPQAVYDANVPIILDVLNTMAKEAKEIEKVNAKMKKK